MSRLSKFLLIIFAVWAALLIPSTTLPIAGTARSAMLPAGYLLLPVSIVFIWSQKPIGTILCVIGAILTFSFGLHRGVGYGIELAMLHLIVLGIIAIEIVIKKMKVEHGA